MRRVERDLRDALREYRAARSRYLGAVRRRNRLGGFYATGTEALLTDALDWRATWMMIRAKLARPVTL